MAGSKSLRTYSLTFFEPKAFDSMEFAVAAAQCARNRGAAPLLHAERKFGIPSAWRGPDWYGLNKVGVDEQ